MQPDMSPTDAINILNTVVANASMNRNDHARCQMAVTLLTRLLGLGTDTDTTDTPTEENPDVTI